jgi:ABC-type Fe3+-siderophore transport system permease subunit
MYGLELDNYMYESGGYAVSGMMAMIFAIATCFFFYYIFKPMTNQKFKWGMVLLVNVVLDLFYALYHTMTPLVNNEIDPSQEWSYLDCFMFGITDALLGAVFFIIFCFIIKWKSTVKYVPFGI